MFIGFQNTIFLTGAFISTFISEAASQPVELDPSRSARFLASTGAQLPIAFRPLPPKPSAQIQLDQEDPKSSSAFFPAQGQPHILDRDYRFFNKMLQHRI